MIFQALECNPRLVATGGYCADHSNAIYSNLLDPRQVCFLSCRIVVAWGFWRTGSSILLQ